MADHQHAALPFLQPGFQPFHGFNVQVVGGLIQQQQVGFAEQQSCQHCAGALPAGKLRDGAVKIDWQETQPHQGLADAQFVGVAAQGVKLKLALAVIFQVVVGEVVFQLRQFRLASDQFGEGAQALFPQWVAAFQHGFLRQVAHPGAARGLHRAAGGFFLPHQDAQQGGLAYAVGAHQPDAGAMGNAERNPGEDVIGTEGLGEVEGAQQRHGELSEWSIPQRGLTESACA